MHQQQCAIFIDAGFLLSAGTMKVTGSSLRSSVNVDIPTLIRGVASCASEHMGHDPFRIYWYDASREGVMREEHKEIALLDDVKVRLGRIGFNGQQKGVDLRLGLDLVEVARNRVARVAYLLTGDDDLAEAVEAAQDLGMKVVLIGLEETRRVTGVASVATHLALQVDRILTLPNELISSCFKPTQRQDDLVRVLPQRRSIPSIRPSDIGGVVVIPPPVAEEATPLAEAPEGSVAANESVGVQPVGDPLEGAPTEPPAEQDEAAADSVSRRHDLTDDIADEAKAKLAQIKLPTPAALRKRQNHRPQLFSLSEPAYSTEADPELLEIAREVATAVARSWHAGATETDLEAVLEERPYLPIDIDATLLRDCAARIGTDATERQLIRRHLRQCFWETIDVIH
ncbi:NYN domain-containing protein [Dermabacteraceae bacterium TAE3-ERU27]|nr:NYN domain-containing protein [Dermabacteraceae bacterium TAE3-ERU27]